MQQTDYQSTVLFRHITTLTYVFRVNRLRVWVCVGSSQLYCANLTLTQGLSSLLDREWAVQGSEGVCVCVCLSKALRVVSVGRFCWLLMLGSERPTVSALRERESFMRTRNILTIKAIKMLSNQIQIIRTIWILKWHCANYSRWNCDWLQFNSFFRSRDGRSTP